MELPSQAPSQLPHAGNGVAEGLIPHLQSRGLWAGLRGCLWRLTGSSGGGSTGEVRGLTELSNWKEFPGA